MLGNEMDLYLNQQLGVWILISQAEYLVCRKGVCLPVLYFTRPNA